MNTETATSLHAQHPAFILSSFTLGKNPAVWQKHSFLSIFADRRKRRCHFDVGSAVFLTHPNKSPSLGDLFLFRRLYLKSRSTGPARPFLPHRSQQDVNCLNGWWSTPVWERRRLLFTDFLSPPLHLVGFFSFLACQQTCKKKKIAKKSFKKLRKTEKTFSFLGFF